MLGLRSSSGARSCRGSDGDDMRDSVFLEMPSSNELPCRPKEYDRNNTNDTNQSLLHFGTKNFAKFQIQPGLLLVSIGYDRIIHCILCGGIN